jgi:hypothetical protein
MQHGPILTAYIASFRRRFTICIDLFLLGIAYGRFHPVFHGHQAAMKIKQLSLFLENKPGHLSSVCQTLADAGVSILTLSLADTQQFGILRLIVPDWEKAKSVLEQTGNVVNATDVLATEVEDRPGGLATLLKILEQSQVNVEYMYAFTFHKDDKAVIFFRFDDPDKAMRVLEERKINVVGPVDLFGRAGS